MQVRAIFEAACRAASEGVDVHPEVMIPLAGHWRELEVQQLALVEEGDRLVVERLGVAGGPGGANGQERGGKEDGDEDGDEGGCDAAASHAVSPHGACGARGTVPSSDSDL